MLAFVIETPQPQTCVGTLALQQLATQTNVGFRGTRNTSDNGLASRPLPGRAV
jgi:hypothetical protein